MKKLCKTSIQKNQRAKYLAPLLIKVFAELFSKSDRNPLLVVFIKSGYTFLNCRLRRRFT